MAINKTLNPLTINLDSENPRFSLFNFENENDIINYLIEFENIKMLAINLIDSGYIGLGERLIVKEIKRKNKTEYIVLEGNRRVAALKLIFEKPYVFTTKIREQIKNLDLSDYQVACDIIQESDEDIALYKIASKHIEGIKEWTSTDKKVFYNKLFSKHRDAGFSLSESLSAISEMTPDTKSNIKKAIRELRFINLVYNETKKHHKNLENLSHLHTDVLISRVLTRIKDDLKLKDNDDLYINYDNNKEITFKNILHELGRATWIDNTINTRILRQKKDWEKISITGELLPNLKNLLDFYKSNEHEVKTTHDILEVDSSDPHKISEEIAEVIEVEDFSSNSKKNGLEKSSGEKDFLETSHHNENKSYKLFTIHDRVFLNTQNYNLLDNIVLYDNNSEEISKNSSMYSEVKFSCNDPHILVKDNIVDSISKNSEFNIKVQFRKTIHSFELVLNIKDKVTYSNQNSENLIEEDWYSSSVKKLVSLVEYNKIIHILEALKQHNTLSKNNHNIIVVSLLLRLLIECSTKAYLISFTKEDTSKSLPQLVNAVAQHLKTKGLFSDEQVKSIKRNNDLEKLNGNIHHYKTSISSFEIQSIMQAYKLYLDEIYSQISSE